MDTNADRIVTILRGFSPVDVDVRLRRLIKRTTSARTANEIAYALAQRGNAPLAREALAIGLERHVPDAESLISALDAVAYASVRAGQTREVFEQIPRIISACHADPNLQESVCIRGFSAAAESLLSNQDPAPAVRWMIREMGGGPSSSLACASYIPTFAPILANKDAAAAHELLSAARRIAERQETPDLLARLSHGAVLSARHATDSNQLRHVSSLLRMGLDTAFDVHQRAQDAFSLRNALIALAELAPQVPVTNGTDDLFTDEDLAKISRLAPILFPLALSIHTSLTESLVESSSRTARGRSAHAYDVADDYQEKNPEIRMPTGETCVTAALASRLRVVVAAPTHAQELLSDLIRRIALEDPDLDLHMNMCGDAIAAWALQQAQSAPSVTADDVATTVNKCCDGQERGADQGIVCTAFALSAATKEQKKRGLVIFTAPEGPVAVNGDFCGPLSRVEDSLTMRWGHPALPNLQWFHNIRDRWAGAAGGPPLPTFSSVILQRQARTADSRHPC